MCGIYAELRWDGRVDENVVVACRDEMITRGPDDAGLYVSSRGEAALGHRRLSIIDLSEAARQPLSNEDGSVRVVANGEIYNFRQLRADLQERGHVFATGSDSEVLVHGWEEWRETLPERLRGMFAIAIWDDVRRELFVCRDRFGIKPLYVWRAKGHVAVASDLRAFVAHPEFRRVVDGRALGQFLCYGFVPAPRSIFADVEKVEPARWLRLSAEGREATRAYWSFPEEDGVRRSDDDVAAEVAARLEDALQSHLVADVPLGLLLSGGTDSTVLACLMRDALPGGFSTFTIGYEGHDRSEAADARRVAELVGATHTEGEGAVPNTDALLDEIAETYTEPMADTSAIPVLGLSEMTRRSVKVALGGDGGDEVFAGYPNVFRRIRPVGSAARKVRFRVEQLLSGAVGPREQLLAFHAARYRLDDWGAVRDALPGIAFDADAQVEPLARHFDPSVPLLRRLQRLETRTFLVDMILAKVDRASMRHSLEVRVPMLDHPLVDFAFRLSARTVMPGKANKHLLRQWLAARVPDGILNKPKAGFGYPLERDFDFAAARARLTDGALVRAGWLSSRWLDAAWDADVPRLRNRRYALAVLESWARRWQPTGLTTG